jgi:hypothetical protein
VRTIAERYYLAARNAGSGLGYDPYTAYQNSFYANYYLQMGTYLVDDATTGRAFASKLRETINAGGIFNLLYHGIETGGYKNIPETLFQEHLDSLALVKEKVWIAGFSSIAQYHHLRRFASNAPGIVINAPGVDYLYFEPVATLPNANWYTEALTYKIPVADFQGMEPYQALQGTDTLAYSYLNADTLLVNAVPNKGGTFVYLRMPASVKALKAIHLQTAVSGNTLKISAEKPLNGTLTLLSIDGRIISQGNIRQTVAEMPFSVASGVYLLRYTSAEGFSYTTRVLKP